MARRSELDRGPGVAVLPAGLLEGPPGEQGMRGAHVRHRGTEVMLGVALAVLHHVAAVVVPDGLDVRLALAIGGSLDDQERPFAGLNVLQQLEQGSLGRVVEIRPDLGFRPEVGSWTIGCSMVGGSSGRGVSVMDSVCLSSVVPPRQHVQSSAGRLLRPARWES